MRSVPNFLIEYLPMDRARELMSDGIEDAFHDSMHKSWRHWKDHHPRLLALPSRTLGALGMHELTTERLAEALDSHPRVHIVPHAPGRRRAHFLIKDKDGVVRMIVQTKKLDHRGLTRNIGTREALQFDKQRPILGIPMGPRLTLGYRLVNSGTDIVTEAVYRIHRKAEWRFELATNRSVEQLHFPDTAQSTPQRRVTRKGGESGGQHGDAGEGSS